MFIGKHHSDLKASSKMFHSKNNIVMPHFQNLPQKGERLDRFLVHKKFSKRQSREETTETELPSASWGLIHHSIHQHRH